MRQRFCEHDLARVRTALFTRRNHPFRLRTPVGRDDAAVPINAEDTDWCPRRGGGPCGPHSGPGRPALGVPARARRGQCRSAALLGAMNITGGGPSAESQLAGRAMASPSVSVPVITTMSGGSGERLVRPLPRPPPARGGGVLALLPLPLREGGGGRGPLRSAPWSLSASGRAPPPSSSPAPSRPPSSVVARLAFVPRRLAAGFALRVPAPLVRCGGLGLRRCCTASAPPGRASRAELLALLLQQRHCLVQCDLVHHHATRQVGHHLTVLDIRTEAALAHRYQFLDSPGAVRAFAR